MVNYNNYGNVVNEYYVRRFREVAQKRRERLQNLKNAAEAQAYVAEVRQKVRSAFDLSFWEKVPFNTQVIKSFTAGNIRIDTLKFDLGKDFPATAYYMRPVEFSEPLPAVLSLIGHNAEGKAGLNAVLFGAALASQGMAVLAIDPIAQGERIRPDASCQLVCAHNILSKKLLAMGHWFGEWRAYEARRGIDWLWENADIDRRRIYVSGCSGGGTMTALTTALDDRLAGAVPSCYISSWQHIVENELPIDAEQMPPRVSALGCEMADLLLAVAPRRILIMGESNDFFDVRGARETYEELKKFYALLGYADRVELFVGPNGHGLWKEQQLAGRLTIGRWAGLSEETMQKVQVPEISRDALQVFPQEKSVFALPHVRTPDQVLQDKLTTLAQQRTPLTYMEQQNRLRDALQITGEPEIPYYRILRLGIDDQAPKETFFSRFLLESNSAIWGMLHLHQHDKISYQPEVAENVVLYLTHANAPLEIRAWETKYPDAKIYSFDNWGMGELAPCSCDMKNRSFFDIYGAEYHFCGCGMMLNESVLGRRVQGIIAALKLLRSRGAKHITLIGAAMSSLPAALATFLCPDLIQKTILVNPLDCYASLFKLPDMLLPQSAVIPGLLKWGDLPDIYRQIDAEVIQDSKLPQPTLEFADLQ